MVGLLVMLAMCMGYHAVKTEENLNGGCKGKRCGADRRLECMLQCLESEESFQKGFDLTPQICSTNGGSAPDHQTCHSQPAQN